MACSECGKCCNCSHARNISEMIPGEVAIISCVSAEGPLRARILDMGLTKGVSVKMLKKAPLGDPIVLKVRGYELSIRRQEAKMITVMQ